LLSHIKSDAFPTSLYTWNGDAPALPIGASCFGYVYEGVPHGHARFMCTREAPIHERITQVLVAASERDTSLVFRTMHNTARFYRNAITTEVVTLEKRGAKFEDIRHLVPARGKLALQNGEVDQG
jgi:nitronate monooxygenase